LSIVLITHDEAIAARAGRVIRMRDGRIAEAASAMTA
jgi:predicted ABC-type transport system involved in lysophospholipase L1 biosynthesis ATPase subunit